MTTIKKISLYQESVSINRSKLFHMLFTEFDNQFYLIVLQQNYKSSVIISTEVHPRQRCKNIHELFNISIVKLHAVRRLKYYHIPCQRNLDLVCFHDKTYM